MHQFLNTLNPAASDVIFDVGAHLGVKTKDYLATGARVVCIEPQPLLVASLTQEFDRHPMVAIEPVALGAAPGEAEMEICDVAPTISTLAGHWKSGRFRTYRWDRSIKVPVSTLDAMIERYGVPVYTKIDVEGFEREVLTGLSQRAGVISFEFNQDFPSHGEECLAKLESLGYTRFQISWGEDDHFYHPTPLPIDEFLAVYRKLMTDTRAWQWGDIYAF